ncbi:MAG: Pyrrolo-quinoline quinone, partial [Candidatus Solibacter sp.]|nr:Pyrrolo-quinoline quinone [Candidatus Solibacter sp.]
YLVAVNVAHDWDSTQTPILADMPFNGRTRKIVMTAERNGYFFVLDRVTCDHLVTGKACIITGRLASTKRGGRSVTPPTGPPCCLRKRVP